MPIICQYELIMKILVAQRIKDLMKSEKLTQMQLAHALEVGQSSISDWLNSKSEPSIENLWKLADFFDVSVDYLIGRKEI